jgi:uncharacterized protein
MERFIKTHIETHLKNHRLLLLFGTKGVGKTKLLLEVISDHLQLHIFNAEDKKTQDIFEKPTKESLKFLFEDKKYIIIENAQQLAFLEEIIEIILFEEFNLNLILTFTFEPKINDELREAIQLQGLEMYLYPPMFQELAKENGIVDFDKSLDERLIFGNYEAVIKLEIDEKIELLKRKIKLEIFTHFSPNDRINKEAKLFKMLQVLAFEIGNPIFYNDVAFKSDLDNETVERYIDLLEKAFILIKIPSFYNKNKYELKKTNLIYFIDNGIRNALINNFNQIDIRNDVDALWKNWLISERIKSNSLHNRKQNYFFWRTHTRQEVEFIEVNELNEIKAYNSIWDKRKKSKFPPSFQKYYPQSKLYSLNKSTYWSFLSGK